MCEGAALREDAAASEAAVGCEGSAAREAAAGCEGVTMFAGAAVFKLRRCERAGVLAGVLN